MENPPVSQRLQEQLGQMIASAPPDSRLPSEPELAQMLKVSRATLREAMRMFETQGLIRRRQGSGTYVNRHSTILETGLEVLESLDTLARRFGLSMAMGELVIQRRQPNPEEEQLFSLAPEEEVIEISRVKSTESRPVAYQIDILPVHVLNSDDLSVGFDGSVLDLLMQRDDIQPSTSFTEINAVTASPTVARALGVQRGVGLLLFSANLYSSAGEIIDRSYSYFLPGFFRFHVVRRIEKIK